MIYSATLFLFQSQIKADLIAVPRTGPRNMRVFDATTNTLTIGWDHAEGPVRQYKIAYAPMTGDPITQFVSATSSSDTKV